MDGGSYPYLCPEDLETLKKIVEDNSEHDQLSTDASTNYPDVVREVVSDLHVINVTYYQNFNHFVIMIKYYILIKYHKYALDYNKRYYCAK